MKILLKNLVLLPALITGLISIPTGRVEAQTFTTLHNFTDGIDGVAPQAGLVLSGNVLYGTTEYGGPSGNNSTLFAVNTNGSGFRIVYNFSAEATNNLGFYTNSDAGGSDGTLVLSGNTLYGASYYGGTNGTGAVFAVNTNSTFTLLHTFSAGHNNLATGLFTNSDGYGAEAGMILSGSTLYGTTENGGTKGYGVVFKVSTNGTGFVNLYNFTNGTDGSIPHTLVISGGTLYGTTLGYSGNGTVFALGTNGTGFTTLHSFTATNFTFPQGGPAPGPLYTNSDGVGPGGLILSGNTLYGTAGWGGTNGNGTVFTLNTNGMGFTILHNFAASKTNSSGVYTNSEGSQTIAFSGLVLSSNTLYGTAYYGGSAGNGTVFDLNTNGTGFTTLYSFSDTDVNGNNSDGANPYAGLTLSGNTLYGTAYNGGTNSDGTVFSIHLGLWITTTSLPNATNGVAYSQILTAFGGQPPYRWTNISGALPTGLTLATNGVISGTPTTNGTFNFTVKVIDAASSTATEALVLTVIPLQVTTVSLPNGTNGLAYSQQLSAIYGQLPYSWTISSGALPTGLTLVTNGLISGTPTTNGTFNFTVQVNDANNSTATQALALTVLGPPSVTLQPTNNSIKVTVGSNVNFTVSVSGTGPFSYQWQLNGSDLISGIISTEVGSGAGGYSGDGGPATNASLFQPYGVAVDATGNLFIADTFNSVIRKVGVNGIITTVAGNGTNGYSGDGGAASNAEFYYPYGVAVDTTGNLFIADFANFRIRKVGTDGIITTVAGNGTNGYSGDGGAATNAELNYPWGLAVDAMDNLFIADRDNSRIRKVGTNGIITTVAGDGTSGFSGDGGAATNAELNTPDGVAVDATGNLFIADMYNYRIREVGTNGIITTVAGDATFGFSGDGATATNAELHFPEGVAVDAIGNLFIADFYNNRIREVGTNGIIITVAGGGSTGLGDGGLATNAELDYPGGVAVDGRGNLFIGDTANERIREVEINSSFLSQTLVLNDLGLGNAGVYDVVVSGPFGSVTSSVVNLTISLPPLILSSPQISVSKTNFTFLLSGPVSSNYVLQVSTNLLNWTPVSTSTIPVSGSVNLSNVINGYNRQFYRAHLQ